MVAILLGQDTAPSEDDHLSSSGLCFDVLPKPPAIPEPSTDFPTSSAER